MAASANNPVSTISVAPRTVHPFQLIVTTSALEKGRAGSFGMLEAHGLIPGATIDLSGASVTEFVEVTTPTPSGGVAAVTDDPVFMAAGGPASEDIYAIPVDDSTGFSVGNYLRAQEQPLGQGMTYHVLAIPDGTHIRVHAWEDHFDIEDGDTLEQVDASGVYSATFRVVVDDVLDLANPNGQVIVSYDTTDTGDGPVFAARTVLSWIRTLELDPASFSFRTG